MLLRSNDLESQVEDYLRSLQTRQLLIRGPTLVDVLRANLDKPERWLNFTTQLAAKSTGWDAIGPVHLAGAAAIALLGFVVGRIVPRRIRARAARIRWRGPAPDVARPGNGKLRKPNATLLPQGIPVNVP
jgi:hypothetical protein